MKTSEFKSIVKTIENINFELPNGMLVPSNFHVTEVGLNVKYFMDCGGELRTEKFASMQLWVTTDFDHRLSPSKLLDIITKSSNSFSIDDLELEVEYQGIDTISKFGLSFDGQNFKLTSKFTDCLAKDKCGVPQEQPTINIVEISQPQKGCCGTGGGCC